jgi:hypothetical protein
MIATKLPTGSAWAKKKYLERIRLESVYPFSRGIIFLSSILFVFILTLATLFVGMMATKNIDIIKEPFFWPVMIGCPLGIIGVKLSYDAAMVVFDIADSMIDLHHRYDL